MTRKPLMHCTTSAVLVMAMLGCTTGSPETDELIIPATGPATNHGVSFFGPQTEQCAVTLLDAHRAEIGCVSVSQVGTQSGEWNLAVSLREDRLVFDGGEAEVTWTLNGTELAALPRGAETDLILDREETETVQRLLAVLVSLDGDLAPSWMRIDVRAWLDISGEPAPAVPYCCLERECEIWGCVIDAKFCLFGMCFGGSVCYSECECVRECGT